MFTGVFYFTGLEADSDPALVQAKKAKFKPPSQFPTKLGLSNDPGKIPTVRRGSTADAEVAAKKPKIEEKSGVVPSPTATAPPPVKKLPPKRIFYKILQNFLECLKKFR